MTYKGAYTDWNAHKCQKNLQSEWNGHVQAEGRKGQRLDFAMERLRDVKNNNFPCFNDFLYFPACKSTFSGGKFLVGYDQEDEYNQEIGTNETLCHYQEFKDATLTGSDKNFCRKFYIPRAGEVRLSKFELKWRLLKVKTFCLITL